MLKTEPVDLKGLSLCINDVHNSPSKTGGNMGRHREPKTAQEEIASVLKWAERHGFQNIAAALRRALATMRDE